MSSVDSMLNDIREALNKIESSNKMTIDEPNTTDKRTAEKYDDDYFEKNAQEYIEFTYECPTIYHVVQYFSAKLKEKGFTFISEKESWSSIKPGKYFTHRNGCSLVAFVVGDKWTPEKGVGAIGSHIDALTVLLKPNSTKEKVEGYELLGVADYASALTNLWWDRDLGIGGRLIVKDPSTKKLNVKLVDSTPHPIARIPTLAPHFGTPAQGPFNKETQAVPVVGFSTGEDAPATEDEKKSPLYGKHSLKLLRYIAKIANIEVSQIVQWDLQLFDVQKGTRGGLDKEFIFAPRVDDRICSYAAISALLEADTDSLLKSDSFSIVGLFDNEEIGSLSRQGARGGLLNLVVSRVLSSSFFSSSTPTDELVRQAFANSFILSADVIHLLNPNFANVYLEHHKPVPNKGITITLDSNGHVTTDSTGLSLIEEIAKLNGDEVQYFQIRNDSRSGGTIGPYISTQTGARTIDLGIPQLSMHSIRATVGAKDVGLGIKFFTGYFSNWRSSYDNYSDEV